MIKINIVYIIATAVCVGLVIYCITLRSRADNLKDELTHAEALAASYASEIATLRREYETINEALNDAAKRQEEADARAQALIIKLDEAQREIDCGPVPPVVSDGLRRFVAEINAAATRTDDAVNALPRS